ncbi:MAG: hypothetical protein QOG10_6722 [Kribbellaceae bacterium]|nr:hypothetical protein [Kribbellaceae bacterium]
MPAGLRSTPFIRKRRPSWQTPCWPALTTRKGSCWWMSMTRRHLTTLRRYSLPTPPLPPPASLRDSLPTAPVPTTTQRGTPGTANSGPDLVEEWVWARRRLRSVWGGSSLRAIPRCGRGWAAGSPVPSRRGRASCGPCVGRRGYVRRSLLEYCCPFAGAAVQPDHRAAVVGHYRSSTARRSVCRIQVYSPSWPRIRPIHSPFSRTQAPSRPAGWNASTGTGGSTRRTVAGSR